MNREYLLYHLREAQGLLDQTIDTLETGGEDHLQDDDYAYSLQRLYYLLNMAWSGRNPNPESTEEWWLPSGDGAEAS